MNNAERVIQYLQLSGEVLCDDCLSKLLAITPRQQVNQICNRITAKRIITRDEGACGHCRRTKTINTLAGSVPSLRAMEAPAGAVPIPTTSLSTVSSQQPPHTGCIVTEISSKEFEARVGMYLERTLNQTFAKRRLSLGNGQTREFDLVSADDRILVECKRYKWTETGNVPSAKIATLHQAILFLNACPGDRKIIALHHRPFPDRKLLADYFCEKNPALLVGIEVWDFIVGPRPEDDRVRVVVGGQP